MYLADYHTHTQFSPDAHDPMTVMAQAALDAGMDEICFTDHVEPLTWGSNELRPPYDWSALTADFANVQAALGDRIHLRLGMEMGDAQKAPAHMKSCWRTRRSLISSSARCTCCRSASEARTCISTRPRIRRRLRPHWEIIWKRF